MTQYQSKSKKGQFNPPSAGGNTKSKSALRAGEEKVKQLENQAQQMIGRQQSYLAVMDAKFRAEQDNRSEVYKFETEQADLQQEQITKNYNQQITNAKIEGERDAAFFKSIGQLSTAAGNEAYRIINSRQKEYEREEIAKGTDYPMQDSYDEFNRLNKQADEKREYDFSLAKKEYIDAERNLQADSQLEMGVAPAEVAKNWGVDLSVYQKRGMLKTQYSQLANWLQTEGLDAEISTKNIVGYTGVNRTTTIRQEIDKGDWRMARAIDSFFYTALAEKYKKSGLSDVFIRENGRKGFNEKMERVYQSRYATYNRLASQQREVDKAKLLHYKLQEPGSNIVESWMATQGNRGSAKTFLYGHLESMFKEGLVDDPVIYFHKLMDNQMIDIGGREMSLKDAWGEEFQYQALYQEAVEARKNQNKTKDNKTLQQAQELVQGAYQAGSADGNFSRDQYDKTSRELLDLQQSSGVDLNRYRNQLGNLFRSSRPGKINQETAVYNLNIQLGEGSLTVRDIEESGLPVDQQKKFLNDLKQYGSGADGSGGGKSDIKSFNTLIRSFGDKGRLDTSTNYTFIGAEEAAKDMYIRRFEVYKNDPKLSPGEARLKAKNDVIAEIQKKQGMFYVEEDLAKQQKYGRGQAYFPHFMIGGGASTPSGIGPGGGAALIEKVRQDINLINTESLASDVELQTIANNIREGKSFHVPYFIQKVAEETGVDKIEILNKQLTRAGLKEQSKITQWKENLIPDTDQKEFATFLENWRGATYANVAVAASPNALPAKIPLGKRAGSNAVSDIAIKLGSGVPELFVGMYSYDSNGYTIPIAGAGSPAETIQKSIDELNLSGVTTYREALDRLPDGAQKTYVENHLKFQQINLDAQVQQNVPIAQNPTFMSRNSRAIIQSQRPFGPNRGAAKTTEPNSMDQVASGLELQPDNSAWIGSPGDRDGEQTGLNMALGPAGGGRGRAIILPTSVKILANGTDGNPAFGVDGTTGRLGPNGQGHGNYMAIEVEMGGRKFEVVMGHLDGRSPLADMKPGSIVPAGTVLGLQGASGRSLGGANLNEVFDHISLHVNGIGFQASNSDLMKVAEMIKNSSGK